MRSLIFRLPLCPLFAEVVAQYPQLELFMEKQLFLDPLTSPVEYYPDSLDGISEELKNWLKELSAGREISDRKFNALKSLSCWSGLKPLLLAFRHADRPLVGSGLRPLPESVKNTRTNLAVEIDSFLRREWGEDRLKALRRDMANFFSDHLKIRKKKASTAAKTRDRGYERYDSEHALEGFSRDYLEPSPLWRCAYVRALGDLAVDSSGNGHLIHNILHKVAGEDPSSEVRKWAKQVENRLRSIRGGMEENFHEHRLFQAFWWIRRTHLLTLQSPINEKEALKTRNTEYRR